MIDRLLQFEEILLLLQTLGRNIGDPPRLHRLARRAARHQMHAGAIPARLALGIAQPTQKTEFLFGVEAARGAVGQPVKCVGRIVMA
jgi:hypothetical protein